MSETEFVILVDENNNELGLMEKHEAHAKAVLHRAFSVFIFNAKGELLLQQRAHTKYHSGGLWTNTCCSHPRSNETTIEAAHRRLMEEMGFDCELTERFHFLYQTPFENGLSEHELDFVFSGIFDGNPKPNTDEVCMYRWISLPELDNEMQTNPERFTIWFRIILEKYKANL